MVIVEILLKSLLKKANECNSRRANYALRTSVDDNIQLMLNV